MPKYPKMVANGSPWASAFLLSIAAFPAMAAPFGIDAGTKVSALKVIEREGTKTYRVEVPQPNSNFDQYRVQASPRTGVCAVYGETKAFPTWEAAKAKRGSIAKMLTKYGKPVHVNPNLDWKTMSMRPPIEAYDLEWRKLASPLSTVSLDVIGINGGQVVRLTYFFRNMAQCQNWEPKQDARGL